MFSLLTEENIFNTLQYRCQNHTDPELFTTPFWISVVLKALEDLDPPSRVLPLREAVMNVIRNALDILTQRRLCCAASSMGRS
jgi:hypothetical protein